MSDERPVLERADDPGAEDEPLEEVRRRRRPTGEPPPLPKAERWRGYRWGLVVAVAVVAPLLLLAYTESAVIASWDQTLARAAADARIDLSVASAKAIALLGDVWLLRVLRWGTIAALVVLRRFRHLIVFVGVVVAVEGATAAMNFAITRPRPMVEILAPWSGFSHPSAPVAGLAVTLLGMTRTLAPSGPARIRTTQFAVAAVVLLALARVHLGVDHVSDVVVGGAMGIGAVLVTFRLIAPSSLYPLRMPSGRGAHVDIDDRRRQAIAQAVADQLGWRVTAIEPIGRAGSAGSTPLELTVRGHDRPEVFAKLYSRQHVRSDFAYKLVRTLLYGRLEDEAPFTNVRRLVLYEDHMSRVLRDAGIPTPTPHGVVEITPEREYLILFDLLDGEELTDAAVDDTVINDGLRMVQNLWAAGVAHRDLKPSNLMLVDGRLHAIDTAFAQLRPTPWRQAVDLGAMMLSLALRSDPDRVYARACEHFREEELGEAVAATRGFVIPTQLREMLAEDERDLMGRLAELAPTHPPIRLHRWGARRLGLLVAVVVGLAVGGVVIAAALRTADLL
jgi:tRNA A-37 threonylcarbamoyl transferase component Bud32/membrane-associated phospholipid phosphatase